MAEQEHKKLLRIGVFRGKAKLEDRSLEKRRTVSIGQDESNTFCILSSAVPKKWDLFVYDSAKDSYTLCLQKSMRGRIVVKKNVEIKVDGSLKPGNGVRFADDKIYITLSNQSRGKIVIGKISILFELLIKRDAAAADRVLLNTSSAGRFSDIFARVLFAAFIISVLMHAIPLIYIGVQDWPRDDETVVIPSWMKTVEVQKMQIEEPEEPEEQPTIVEDGEDVLADAPAPEPSQADDGGAGRDELLDQITDKHREQGALITAQVLGADGGIEGFYADMLGSNAHIADMSDIAAGDIGASAGGNLLNQLAAAEGGGTGSGLMGLDSGKGNAGPTVVVDKKNLANTQRAKVEFKISDKNAEYASAPPPGSKDAIEKLFKKKAGDIKSCYQRVMNAQGKAAGRLVISILVTKDGAVMKVEKIEDQIGGEMFSCVRQRIMNWNFGALKSPIAFKKTWVFS